MFTTKKFVYHELFEYHSHLYKSDRHYRNMAKPDKGFDIGIRKKPSDWPTGRHPQWGIKTAFIIGP